MDRTIEPSLRSLLPAVNGDLPAELLQLARSLYAQSKSKALKPDEEVARSYVCAHLACERLKQSLDLPDIHQKPPCPPRTYKKLYAFFESALPARASRAAAAAPRSNATTPVASPLKARTPSKSTPRATPLRRATSTRKLKTNTEDELDNWVMPVIRELCKTFDAPRAAPHVYAGTSSVVRLLSSLPDLDADTTASPTRTRTASKVSAETSVKDSIPAIIVTVFLYVKIRLSGKESTAREVGQHIEQSLNVLHTGGRSFEKSRKEISSEILRLIKEARVRWLDDEWYQNIPENTGLRNDEGHAEQVDDMDLDEADASVGRKRFRTEATDPADVSALMRGLGTMMQDKVDWCSPARRQDFLEWKEDIEKRMEEIERNRPTAMDTTA